MCLHAFLAETADKQERCSISLMSKEICFLLSLFFFLQVYEHITFNNEKHISLASFTGMQERTIITSSLSKTFSVTG